MEILFRELASTYNAGLRSLIKFKMHDLPSAQFKIHSIKTGVIPRSRSYDMYVINLPTKYVQLLGIKYTLYLPEELSVTCPSHSDRSCNLAAPISLPS